MPFARSCQLRPWSYTCHPAKLTMPSAISTTPPTSPIETQLRPWLTRIGATGRRPPPLPPLAGRAPAAGRALAALLAAVFVPLVDFPAVVDLLAVAFAAPVVGLPPGFVADGRREPPPPAGVLMLT